MGTASVDLAQAQRGLMALERRIIDLANERQIGGLRFEWNDDMDFGHMQDPVPVSIFAPRGRIVEAEFPLAELARFAAGVKEPMELRIHRIVQELAEEA